MDDGGVSFHSYAVTTRWLVVAAQQIARLPWVALGWGCL